MRPVDSHCHLQDKAFEDDREEILNRSLELLEWLVVVGDDIPSSQDAIALTRPRVFATVGIHPYHAALVNEESLTRLREMVRTENVVALGEIGLDYYRHNQTPRDIQQQGLRQQLELAVEVGHPVVIHNRESQGDLRAILADYHTRIPGAVMHCFAGDSEFLHQCLKWGLYISFAGNVTFPKARELREAAHATPIDRLLVETDSPYLAPQPLRGKRCEPPHVQHTVQFLAQLRGITPEELAETTTDNAQRLFQIP